MAKRKYKKRRRWTGLERKRLRNYHAQGLNDRQIGERLKRSHVVVRRERIRLGLPANPLNDEAREKSRRKTAEARKGILTEKARAAAAEMGWPGVGGPKQAAVLSLLERRPEMSAREIAEELQIQCCTVHQRLSRLRREGFVAVASIRKIGGDSSRQWERLWRLADGIKRHEPKRVRGEGKIPPMPYHLSNRRKVSS